MCLFADKLQLCIEKWTEIVKEEYRQQELGEALDNLHLSSYSDMTSVQTINFSVLCGRLLT